MKDTIFTKIERERSELLDKISDLSLKERLIRLGEVFNDIHEEAFRSDTIPKLPQFYRKEILEIFSKKNHAVMNYLLANTDYLREFMGNLKFLDQIFETMCDSLDILDIYSHFSYFPDHFVKHFIDNFGRIHNHVINDYISLNLDHMGEGQFKLKWRVNVYVCGSLVGELSTFYTPDSSKTKVIPDLIILAKSLDEWVKKGFPVKLLNKSIAIPILEKMQVNNAPNVAQILSEYKTSGNSIVKSTPRQLANKKITVYQGEVTSISHLEQKKLESGNYKGITYQREEVRIILKDVKIIPFIKKNHKLSEEEVELEVDELEVVTFPNIFEENPVKVGDFVYCYGEINSRPAYKPYRLVYYLNAAFSGHYDIKKGKKSKKL